jgi:uncharacterized protein YjbJ (UPF0337 family)
MSNDRIEGAATNAMGHVQDGFGGLVGDQQTQAKGKLNQAAGTLQANYGKAVEQAQAAFDQAKDKTETYVREKPMVALGIVGGASLLLGMLLRGGRKRA